MWHLRAKVTLLVISSVGTIAYSDSWHPYVNRRETDPSGRYYIVMEKSPGWDEDPGRGGPVTFTIAEQRPDSEPVTSAWNELGDPIERFGERIEITNPDVAVRDGDILHGTGSLARAPLHLLISTTGLGFVAMDVHGYNYGSPMSGSSVVVVSLDGSVRHRKSLVDLFSEDELSGLEAWASAGGIDWWQSAWIDEHRREVVVVCNPISFPGPHLIRIIDWESGDVREGSSDDITTALTDMNRNALRFAIDLAIEEELPNTDLHLIAILENEDLPLSNRAHAAVALTTLGHRLGIDMIKEFAVTAQEDSFERRFVIRNLYEIFGVEAAPILQEATRQCEEYGDDIPDELDQIGTAAIPTLIDMVNDDTNPWGQRRAVSCLGRLGPAAAEAVPSLIAYSMRTTLMEEHRFLVARTFGEIGSASVDAIPILEEWERDAQAKLESIEAAEAINPPGPYASQVWIAEFRLEEISRALRRLERNNH